MPVTFYNVSPVNNRISYTDGNGAHTAILPPGYYSTSQYLTAIGTNMTIGGITYVATKDALTFAVTVTASTGLFSFTFGTNSNHSAATMMGYPLIDTPSAISQSASGLINLAQTRSFNISVNNITATSDLNRIGYSFVVPVTSNTPGVEYYETQAGFQQYIRIDSPTRTLDIVVYDDNNDILPLYSNWYMILQPMDD
jgi:hypothetical protein